MAGPEIVAVDKVVQIEISDHIESVSPASGKSAGGVADCVEAVEEQEDVPEERPLTPAERRELEQLARRPGPTAWLLPSLCWLLTALDCIYLLIGHMQGLQWFAFALVLSVTIFSTLQLWRGFRLKAQVLYDLDLGTLMRDHLDGESVEHLPTSSLLWTIEGQPAPWRSRRKKKPKT